MTLQELNTALSAVLPGKVVYNAWPVGEAPALPYMCYYSTGADNFGADNKVYNSNRNVRIELYTRSKDLATEAALEAKLTHEGIYWTRDESFIDDEKVFLTVYEVTING